MGGLQCGRRRRTNKVWVDVGRGEVERLVSRHGFFYARTEGIECTVRAREWIQASCLVYNHGFVGIILFASSIGWLDLSFLFEVVNSVCDSIVRSKALYP